LDLIMPLFYAADEPRDGEAWQSGTGADDSQATLSPEPGARAARCRSGRSQIPRSGHPRALYRGTTRRVGGRRHGSPPRPRGCVENDSEVDQPGVERAGRSRRDAVRHQQRGGLEIVGRRRRATCFRSLGRAGRSSSGRADPPPAGCRSRLSIHLSGHEEDRHLSGRIMPRLGGASVAGRRGRRPSRRGVRPRRPRP
jgi:hypothetical protein